MYSRGRSHPGKPHWACPEGSQRDRAPPDALFTSGVRPVEAEGDCLVLRGGVNLENKGKLKGETLYIIELLDKLNKLSIKTFSLSI